jgi:hypothetical protein
VGGELARQAVVDVGHRDEARPQWQVRVEVRCQAEREDCAREPSCPAPTMPIRSSAPLMPVPSPSSRRSSPDDVPWRP